MQKQQSKNGLTRKKLMDYGFVASLLVIPIVQFLIFWVYINFDSILMAFEHPATGEWTLANFERLFQSWNSGIGMDMGESVLNTVYYFLFNNFVMLTLSIVFSYLLFKKVFLHGMFRVIFFLPNIINQVVMCTLFIYLMEAGGPVMTLIESLGIHLDPEVVRNGPLATESTAWGMILLYMLWSGFGMNIVLQTGALGRIPEDIFEYARIDGVGMVREFAQIVVPLIWPTITTLFVFGLAGIFNMSGPVLLLTEGEYGTSTIGYYILHEILLVSKGTGNLNYPAAVGLFFTVIGVPLVLGTKALLDRIGQTVEY